MSRFNRKIKKLFRNPQLFIQDGYLKYTKFKHLEGVNVKTLHMQIEKFISDYDVNSMKVGSEYIWPYIRHHFWANINAISLGQYTDYNIKPYRIQGGHESQLPHELRLYLEAHYTVSSLKNITLERSDILFFVMQNAVEKQYVDCKVYHKVIDPYYAAAQKITTAQKVEIIRTRNLANDWDNYAYSVNLLLLPSRVKKKYISGFRYSPDFFSKMRKHLRLLRTLTPIQLTDLVNYELAMRDFYIQVLKVVQPKVICLNYFHRYAPLISAADKLGILTVDLQHGIQDGDGFLYGHYPELVGRDYQALPDYFAVWSQKNALHIMNTFHSVNRKHRPIIMGNAWWKGFVSQIPLPAHLQDRISKNSKCVLLILQKQLKVPEAYKSLINSSGKDVLWLVRHHPKGRRFTISDFGNAPNVIIGEMLDKLSLQQLLSVDLTVSEGSALSLELRACGIPGIIFSEDGKKNYENAINQGLLRYYPGIPENIDVVLDEINTDDIKKIDFYDDIQPADFIRNLLNLSDEKRR